jgi:hydroxyethylthiazole kinase-like uncharacterized protein yjeF
VTATHLPHTGVPDDAALLTVEQMYAADRAAMAAGRSGTGLMEAAGAGAARAIIRRWAPRPTVILCGPGNNGGDGFVVARHLARHGWRDVRVALLGERSALAGDAAVMASMWDDDIVPIMPRALDGRYLVVDAVFGAGLARPVDGAVAATLEAAASSAAVRVAIDVPSGVSGDTGQVLGTAMPADLTVTFFRPKPGHLLLPGRALCGERVVVDIGIPRSVLGPISPAAFANRPALWRSAFPSLTAAMHKYGRGHAVVLSGGPSSTGAARLAAAGALRIGAGLVTVVGPRDALSVNASQLTAVMTDSADDPAELRKILSERRRNAVLVGPGNGVTAGTRENALAVLASGAATVVDADAITVFADDPESLFSAISAPCVMTPHAGEFVRVFGQDRDANSGKAQRAAAAAKRAGAVVLLKGGDTVVAAPDGRVAIAENAPPDLATAGTGDVLAGFVLGLLAQGMPAFEAAAAAVWLHGEAARLIGRGLVAEDLAGVLPGLLQGIGVGKASARFV